MSKKINFVECNDETFTNGPASNVDCMTTCEPVNEQLGIVLFPDKGRGIITLDSIGSGVILERALVGTFPPDERRMIEDTKLFEWYFVRPDEYRTSHIIPGHIIFGFSSICNHSSTPNARIDWEETEHNLWANLITLENIEKGNEVVSCYTNITEYADHEKFI